MACSAFACRRPDSSQSLKFSAVSVGRVGFVGSYSVTRPIHQRPRPRRRRLDHRPVLMSISPRYQRPRPRCSRPRSPTRVDAPWPRHQRPRPRAHHGRRSRVSVSPGPIHQRPRPRQRLGPKGPTPSVVRLRAGSNHVVTSPPAPLSLVKSLDFAPWPHGGRRPISTRCRSTSAP